MSTVSPLIKLEKKRKTVNGPEAEFVRTALRMGLKLFFDNPDKLLFEPAFLTGYPDLVAIYKNEVSKIKINKFKNISKNHFRVLSYVISLKKVEIEDLFRNLLFKKTEIEKILFDLEKIGSLKKHRGNIILSEPISKLYPIKKIIAVEAKLGNWKKCLMQAIINTWFASESYILIPDLKNIREISVEAKKHGVGVLSFDYNKLKIVSKAKKYTLPSSYGSWMFAISH